MSFPDAFLDELKARISLAEVVGKRVRLTRKGREFLGLCPFHSEKTPSFTVNEQKGFYHCFGCGAHGSVFDFVMQSTGSGFAEAVAELAAHVGLPVSHLQPVDAGRRRQDATLLQVIERAVGFFRDCLQAPAAEIARQYLHRRGLSDATIEQFRLGCAPAERDALKRALLAEGIAETTLLEAGLVVQPDDRGGASYDRFRRRIMFPIADPRGRPVAFGGRILGPGEPKYLNSPETALFHKGRTLYGLPAAGKAARERGRLIVVEGYMDVIGLNQTGYPETVAPLGTALTEEQMHLLWQFVPEPVLCFDPDPAGRRAAHRVVERALPLLASGRGFRFAFLQTETGDDPDAVARRYPKQFLERTLAEAIPLSEMLFWSETRCRNLRTPEAKSKVEACLAERVRQIPDSALRHHFLATYRNRLRRGDRGGRLDTQSERAIQVVPQDAAADAARTLLAVLIHHPGLFAEIEEEIGSVQLAESSHDRLRQAIIRCLCGRPDIGAAELNEYLVAAGCEAELREIERDPLVRAHRFIRSTEALGELRTTLAESLAVVQKSQADPDPHRNIDTTEVSDEALLRRFAQRRDALEDSEEA